MKTTAIDNLPVLKWRLREMMARRKVTNRELANYLELHETTIARMKAPDVMPKIDGDTLSKLCKYLDCDISDLLEEVGDEP
ncbi:MAG: helix-turn-helix domain-containing protein [Microcystaceae cyanobacterium]